MANPTDLTNSYNTALTPAQEQAFQAWRSQLPSDLQNGQDYDLRAAFLANPTVSSNQHLDDVGKKPNHMTFSDGSKHSTPQTPGGTWSQISPESPQDPNGVWQFNASPTNLQYHTPDQLLNYFQTVENNGPRMLPNGHYGYGAPNQVVLPNALRPQPAQPQPAAVAQNALSGIAQ